VTRGRALQAAVRAASLSTCAGRVSGKRQRARSAASWAWIEMAKDSPQRVNLTTAASA
jgi:hypothetical protein